MRLWSESLTPGGRIPARFALGRPGAPAEFSDNVSPHLAWSDVPAGAKSLVLICVDVDVPSRGDDVNKEGRVVPVELPRVDFYHLSLVDLPPSLRELPEGALSRGLTRRGKPGPQSPVGGRTGLNDYTGWFQGDPDLHGNYFGYDGPFPPWNDGRLHRYFFKVLALDVARCPLEGTFTGHDVARAVKGRVLAEASLMATYAIYAQAASAP